jgi:hypothetical protein
MIIIISLVFVLILAGCYAFGPVSPSLVAKSVPKEDGKVLLYGSGFWWPNTRGFADFLVHTLVHTPDNYRAGVLVITDNAVVFEQWDKKKEAYYVIKHLPYSGLDKVSMDTFGVSKRIVLRKKDLSYETFEFTNKSGTLIDNTKNEQGINILRERIEP